MSRVKLAEPFGAVPRRLSDALSAGELTFDEFAILTWLELNVNYRAEPPAWHGTTREMAAAMRWPHTPKHLGKTLRGLHARNWLETDAKPRSPKRYAIRLKLAACRRTTGGVCDDCGYASDALHRGRCPECN
jgi:hypothetical protein